MGIYINGMFIATEYRQYKERSTLAVMLAVVTADRTTMYRIYMHDRYSPDDFAANKMGDNMTIWARPYVSKEGLLAWADGEME